MLHAHSLFLIVVLTGRRRQLMHMHIRYYFLADFYITGYATHAVLRKYDFKKNIIGWAEDNSETDFQ